MAEHQEKPVAKLTWRDQPGKPVSPMFYRNVGGRLKRVSFDEGLKMIDEGLIPLTDELNQYIQLRQAR